MLDVNTLHTATFRQDVARRRARLLRQVVSARPGVLATLVAALARVATAHRLRPADLHEALEAACRADMALELALLTKNQRLQGWPT